ncbi:hypothetical protein [uncultured Marivita sp.]|uniref:hypothetical protein n=1 Tax=uncultured Marivita sp. TaxID=888080 RepID=UPI0026110A0D|nr:hypothetical protein [uncultured Marivita sp.]
MGTLFLRRQRSMDLFWCLAFGYLFIDDAFQYHETMGQWLAATFGFEPAFSLRAKDFGEMLATALATSILLTAFLIGYRAANGAERAHAKAFAALFVLLGFFGVVIDMLHIAFRQPSDLPGRLAFRMFGLIEDGGELVTGSVMLIFALAILLVYRSEQAARPAV